MRERLVDENGWQHYVYHQAETNVHYLRGNSMLLESTNGWDINDFVTTTQVQVTVSWLIHSSVVLQ